MTVWPGLFLLLGAYRTAFLDECLFVRSRGFGMFVREEIEIGLADQLAGVAKAKELHHCPVDPREPAITVLEIDVFGQTIHDHVEEVHFLIECYFDVGPYRRVPKGPHAPTALLVGHERFGMALND